jgi:hypothetical protein
VLSKGIVLLLCLTAAACETSHGSAAAPAEAPKPAAKLEFIVAPPRVDVAEWVKANIASEKAKGRQVLVYEGATWCEPCQRFHAAAEAGKLNAAFGNLTLLQFDADRDIEGLLIAGYASSLIPLFALPGPDGRASGKYIEGGIKGEDAADQIVPRLQGLLANNP